MSILDRIRGRLLLEMYDLEVWLDERDMKSNELKTEEIIVHYKLAGIDKFLILDYSTIVDIMLQRAAVLRKELITDVETPDSNK